MEILPTLRQQFISIKRKYYTYISLISKHQTIELILRKICHIVSKYLIYKEPVLFCHSGNFIQWFFNPLNIFPTFKVRNKQTVSYTHLKTAKICMQICTKRLQNMLLKCSCNFYFMKSPFACKYSFILYFIGWLVKLIFMTLKKNALFKIILLKDICLLWQIFISLLVLFVVINNYAF